MRLLLDTLVVLVVARKFKGKIYVYWSDQIYTTLDTPVYEVLQKMENVGKRFLKTVQRDGGQDSDIKNMIYTAGYY